MDSPSFWYALWHRASVHASFVNATLRFVGFSPVRTTTFYSQLHRTNAERAAWIAEMERIGERDGRLGTQPARLSARASVGALPR